MKILLIIMVLMFAGCGNQNDSDQDILRPKEACVRGIVYYYDFSVYWYYMTPKYNSEMKLVSCSMEVVE